MCTDTTNLVCTQIRVHRSMPNTRSIILKTLRLDPCVGLWQYLCVPGSLWETHFAHKGKQNSLGQAILSMGLARQKGFLPGQWPLMCTCEEGILTLAYVQVSDSGQNESRVFHFIFISPFLFSVCQKTAMSDLLRQPQGKEWRNDFKNHWATSSLIHFLGRQWRDAASFYPFYLSLPPGSEISSAAATE